MTLRAGHGNGKGQPRIEVLPADELPRGIAGPERSGQPGIKRDALGRPADAESHREMSRRGGMARQGKTRLAANLGLTDVFADERFKRYAGSAKAFRKVQVQRLAQTVGGGECGPAPASMVASAALQLAASRFAIEVLGDLTLGSRLANDSRQNLLAAHELCAKEAQARPKTAADTPWLVSGGGR